MRLHKGIPHLPVSTNGCVMTIGNFDGVHVGHKAVIEKLVKCGRELGLPVVIMIFEPQPLEYFSRANAPPRLMRLREKAFHLAKLPVDDLVIVRFNKQLANYDAEKFIGEVLVNKLQVKHIVIGDDFRFGKARQGDFAMLKDKGREFGYTVEDTGSLQLAGHRVSSTLIREALANGDLEQAELMLGYPYAVCGRIIHGDKRGRTLGYPTANIKMARKNIPISGVFAVSMTVDGLEYHGVANVGVRPTVDGSDKVILETHLFDFDRDIYGLQVAVHFQHKIRAERRFQTMDELKVQIVDDVAKAKQFFAIT